MSQDEDKKNFKFATSLIKIISVVIALMVLVISKYAFIFFSAAMLPTIFAIFMDKNEHRCMSATICSFNLIGIMPYLMRMWENASSDYISKQILADIETWMIIYGAAFAGQLLYISIPILTVKMYSSATKAKIMKYRKEHKSLCEEWSIKTK